jgi:hypothetical protein
VVAEVVDNTVVKVQLAVAELVVYLHHLLHYIQAQLM